MPIRPENRNRYPKNWKEIRHAILKRAGDKCEGCGAPNYSTHPKTGSYVVLTIAHLNHRPEDNRRSNLRAWCQLCHNTHDAPERARGIKRRRRAAIAEQQRDLLNLQE